MRLCFHSGFTLDEGFIEVKGYRIVDRIQQLCLTILCDIRMGQYDVLKAINRNDFKSFSGH